MDSRTATTGKAKSLVYLRFFRVSVRGLPQRLSHFGFKNRSIPFEQISFPVLNYLESFRLLLADLSFVRRNWKVSPISTLSRLASLSSLKEWLRSNSPGDITTGTLMRQDANYYLYL